MSVLSLTCCSLLSAVCAFTLVSATGCGTDAQGVDDCRNIEQTRCEAAKSCGLVTDVPACQRYYRDQCLHGLPVAPPGSVKLQECVETIRKAGVCATESGDPNTLLKQCEPMVTQGARVLTVCALVKEPEKAQECSFLTPSADGGIGGAGNSDAGENTAGEAGQGGGGAEDGS